jgi:hypothetical protein
VLVEGFIHVPGSGRSEALADGECLPQAGGDPGGVAVLKVGPADAFQSSCLLEWPADITGDGERLGMMVAGLAGG